MGEKEEEIIVTPKSPITVTRRPDGTFVFFLDSHLSTFKAAVSYLRIAEAMLTEAEQDASTISSSADGLEEIASSGYCGINAIDIKRTLDD